MRTGCFKLLQFFPRQADIALQQHADVVLLKADGENVEGGDPGGREGFEGVVVRHCGKL